MRVRSGRLLSPLFLPLPLFLLSSCPRHPSHPLPPSDTAPATRRDASPVPPPADPSRPVGSHVLHDALAPFDVATSASTHPDLSLVRYPLPPSSSLPVPLLPSPLLSFGDDWNGSPTPLFGVRVGPRHPKPDPLPPGTPLEVPVDRDGHPTPGAPVVHTLERTFLLDDPATVVAAFAEAKFAGGIVVRLNGVEWFRSQVDPDRSGPGDLAVEPDDDGRFWVRSRQNGIYQRSFPGLDPRPLRSGENTLSVELHRAPEPDADPLFYFDLRLDLFTSHGFVVAPYLTISDAAAADSSPADVTPVSPGGEPPSAPAATSSGVTVAWDTSAPTTGRVRFGAGAGAGLVVPEADLPCSTHHEVAFPALPVSAEYRYGIAWSPCAEWIPGNDRFERWSPAGSVRPPPLPGRPLVFFAYGDTRAYPERHTRVVQAMLRDAETRGWPAFVLNTGDLTTTGTAETEWREQFFQPLAPLLARVPFVPVFGNHDAQDEDWFLRFRLPGNEAWFSFRAGDAEVFVLDAYARFAPGTPQLRWLEESLAASTAPWRIVALHIPLRSCAANRLRRRTADRLAEWLGPILFRGGVRLVLAGHDHLYGRTVLDGGLTVVTLGGGGAPTYEAREPADGEVCVSALNFARVEIDARRLRLHALDPDGNTLDEFELTREPEAVRADSIPALPDAAPSPDPAAPEGADRAATVLDSPPEGDAPCDQPSP